MSQPYWVTPAGDLGTIPEGVFYITPLLAEDPVVTVNPTAVTNNNGIVTFAFLAQSSTPYVVGSTIVLAGFVPNGYNGSYQVVRASKSTVGIVNATTATVTAFGTIVNAPVAVTFEVIAGALPAGIAINENGIIGGTPQTTIGGVPSDLARDTTSQFAIRARNAYSLADRTFSITVAVLNQPYFVTPAGNVGYYIVGQQIFGLEIDTYNPDIYGVTVVTLVAGSLPPGLSISNSGIISGVVGLNPSPVLNNNYEFTLSVSNGESNNVRTFSIFVYARYVMSADTTQITADDDHVTADVYNLATPVILTPAGLIGTVRTGNFFAFQFLGQDTNTPARTFEYVGTALPPGLELDPNSGFLYGLIPTNGVNIDTYNFQIRVQDILTPELISLPYQYSLNITGPISGDIEWTTQSDLGTVINGSTSTLQVQAVSVSGLVVQYRLAGQTLGDDPVYNRLPQGLEFLSSGNIVGRISFDTFALDSGETTFDLALTTFDMVFTFTVNAFSTNGLINSFRTFTVRLIRQFDQPYDNLYIVAMPPADDRTLLNNLLENDQIFPQSAIYRADDANFGLARQVIYQHAFGLTASTYDNYINSMDFNHYWKNLVLGQIKTAQALDDTGAVIYEVVYSEIVDDLVNNNGQSVAPSVNLPYVIDTALGVTTKVNPNSLSNMRDQVIDTVGQISNLLPRWMLSKQADGSVLGFTAAWVIAYTVPGQSGQIAYNIQTQFGLDQLNLVDFVVDRYELDNLLTKNWNRTNQHWTPRPPTSTRFDFGTQLTSWLNSLNPAFLLPWINDLDGTVGWSYGTPPGTTFDGGSLQFTAPVDMYTTTDRYNVYLPFPQKLVVVPVGTVPLSFINWTYNNSVVTWQDDIDQSGTITWTPLSP